MIKLPIVVLATKNKNKLIELQATLQGMRIDIRSAFDFADLDEVVEDQPTLEGNALKKAVYTAEMTGLPSLSDDTGLASVRELCHNMHLNVSASGPQKLLRILR